MIDWIVILQAGVATGMLFVRNDHGSHNPQESMSTDDLLEATRLLTWWLARECTD